MLVGELLKSIKVWRQNGLAISVETSSDINVIIRT